MRKRIIIALLITIITVSGCGNNDKQENVITSSSTLSTTKHSESVAAKPETSVPHETTSNPFTVSKEYVYIDHNDKCFNFMVQEGVHKKSFDNSRLEKDKIYKYYDPEKREVISHWGIDVSVYQGTIDWKKVSECGVEFAIIRLGYRGYGKEGLLVPDKEFENNIKGAIQAGIQVGVYFFTQALSEEEAIEEAKFVLETIKEYNITYPVIIDTEEIDPKYEPRTINITREQVTKNCIAFCDTINAAGYDSMIYYNLPWCEKMLDMKALNDYQFWYADYTEFPQTPYEFKLWQYSCTGKIDGIQGPVDLNVYIEN